MKPSLHLRFIWARPTYYFTNLKPDEPELKIKGFRSMALT
jgi:hypothetical protein